MAIIGLLDWDLTRWRQPTVFNIDLMKLAYYHKVKCRDVVQMEQKFSSEFCTQVRIQKDYEDFEYPPFIIEDPKVIWNGLALSEGKFNPLPPEIEICPADTSIYNKMDKYYNGSMENKAAYANMMKAVHFRLDDGNGNLIPHWDKQMVPQTKGKVAHFICHDVDLASIRGAYDVIDSVAAEYGRKNFRLGFKFPLHIQTADELLHWGSVTKTPHVSNAYLYTLMPDEVLAELTYFKQQFTYLITNEFWTRETFIEALPKILIQAIFLQSNSITMSLKIDRQFIIENEWHDYVMLFNDYIKSCVTYRNRFIYCMFTYCKYCYFRIFDEQKRDLFWYIKENNEELFDLLYSLEYATFTDGKFVPHMYTLSTIIKGGGYGGYFYRRSNPRENQIEQFNYADIVQPESIYLEQGN